MSATPRLGRNVRLFYNNAAIGYGKNISVKATAEIIKDYSMDALTPAVSGAGKQTFTWSMERLFTDDTYIALLTTGTKLNLVFALTGSPYEDTQYETWTNCTILSGERTASEDKAIIEKLVTLGNKRS